MKKLLLLLLGILCLTASATSVAGFNPKAAAKQLDIIQKKLSRANSRVQVLNANINKLQTLQIQSRLCSKEAKEQLSALEPLLKASKIEGSISLEQADVKYLQEKELFYAKQLSSCRLFIYRSDAILSTYRSKVQKLNTNKILQHGMPFWKLSKSDISNAVSKIDFNKIMSGSGFKIIAPVQWGIAAIGLLLSLFFAYLIKRQSISFSKKPKLHPAFIALNEVISHMIIPLSIVLFFSVFFTWIFYSLEYKPWLKLIADGVLVFVILLGMSQYLLSPPRKEQNLFGLPNYVGKKTHKRLSLVLGIALLSYLFVTLLNGHDFSPTLSSLARTVFIFLFSSSFIWFVWGFSQLAETKSLDPFKIKLLHYALLSILSFTLLAEGMGYHQFALFFIRGVFFTVLSIGLAFAAVRFVNIFFKVINTKKYIIAQRIRRFFGVRPHKSLNEITLIRFVVYFIIAAAFLLAFIKSWQFSNILFNEVLSGCLHGFSIAGYQIVPTKIIFAILSFSAILLSGRFIAATVSRQYRFKGEEDTQVAIASIIIYISFTVALVFALLLTGVNFTGLAIIAGALSVGIGLGLQSIVNNFVSGIILLLEKPIKPGDRIVIGETEGIIKRIRVRSTQITTLAHSDVIVPNADLITNQVVNYMFRDRFWRIECRVGVAYGSDLDKVKQVLENIAAEHPEVQQKIPHLPRVLFKSFEDSHLLFELRCIISDVNRKNPIISDINFAIHKAFADNNIIIPFPQRDIRLINQDKGDS